MVRAIVRIFEEWQLDENDIQAILIDVEPGRYRNWVAGRFGSMTDELLYRLAVLIGIHAQLRQKYCEPVGAYRWLRRLNGELDGKSPLALMQSGDLRSILRIRSHLEADSLF